MESILMVKDLLRKGDFLVKIDLKDAYLTVPIGEAHQKFLRFRWKDALLEFSCLPFGLASAPRVLPRNKVRKIRSTSQSLLENPNTTVRKLSKYLGLLSSSIQVVFPAPLHYRYLQRGKNASLKAQHTYEAPVYPVYQALQEVMWWRDNLIAWNGGAVL
ncbi:uncharacterized protein LOC111319599 [Stylophora pistillata]|uniref:uncharacterized protein LOC111319599 n=1 Tax=Stylophora pistillata TaxID=50429 RepID=UPI000C04C920|nr:uncharacterized protein LOC111319599 [Stylophora pistillata]